MNYIESENLKSFIKDILKIMPNYILLILSAGFGRRMLDLTTNTPKPLLKFRNKTLLGNTINFFRDIGCTEIYINTHYLHEMMKPTLIITLLIAL